MLCPSCRRQLSRSASVCGVCGAPRPGAVAPLELVLPDGTRIPVVDDMTLGRAPGSTLQLADPTVSRTHARIGAGNGKPILEDVGSSAGTFLDDAPVEGPVALHDGARIRLGTLEIAVERHRDVAEAGRTIVVRPGASMLVSAVSSDHGSNATSFGFKPRVRSGYALKRLDQSEGNKRFVLRDLNTGKFLRLSDRDAEVFQLLDGSHSLVEIIGHAEQRFGTGGSARVARLLADLGERGFLPGVKGDDEDKVDAPQGFFRRLFKSREKSFAVVGSFFEKLYERGAWVLFTRPVLIFLAVLIVAGIASFTYLVAGRYGTPFVVAQKIGLGGAIFLAGRFAFVAVHEVAHGLTMASFGRKIERAGLKLVFIFPYAFVDTSEAWFEPRRHRIAVSAAGPVSDFTIGAIFAVLSLAVEGTLRDVFFQLAFAAYIGGLFNLNPFLDRDGYHILVDVLREPGLRRRAKVQFERRMQGNKRESDNRALARYSIAGLVWSFLGAGFAIMMSLRYEQLMLNYAPKAVVYTVMGTIWLVLFIPVFIALGKPLIGRFRSS
jgi:pSer/pThr/pTyr-binding forkhead associated (FHA) protein/Zn-dependent protease